MRRKRRKGRGNGQRERGGEGLMGDRRGVGEEQRK